MKAHNFLPLFFLLLQILRHVPATHAIKYVALNDAKNYPGGARFEAEICIPYTLKIMKSINAFVWNVLHQHDAADRKPVEVAYVYIRQYDGAEAITYGEQINVSALFLQGYQGNLKWEYTSVLHHEMTHVFQWDGEGKAPVGLVEGVADYMKLVSHYDQVGFAKPGMGDKWDQGYDFTARFLEYCEGLKPGFVANLNKMMRYTWSEDYFVKLLGKPVAQLWKEYKAKYATKKKTMYID